MHDLAAHPVTLNKFQRDIVILVTLKPRAQAAQLHREGKAQLYPGIKALEICLIVVQRAFDHLEGKALLRMPVKGAHNAGHVDALLLGLKGHCPGDRGLELQICAGPGAETDRQAEIRNAHMLNLLLCAFDQAFRAVLQIRQCVAIC